MRLHTCVFSFPLYSIKRMDSCYRLYLVFIPNIFYHCRFPFPYNIQRHVLNRREAKSAVKAAKDSMRVLHKTLCVMRTQKNHAAYTHVVLLRSFLEVDDEKKLMRLMVHN